MKPESVRHGSPSRAKLFRHSNRSAAVAAPPRDHLGQPDISPRLSKDRPGYFAKTGRWRGLAGMGQGNDAARQQQEGHQCAFGHHGHLNAIAPLSDLARSLTRRPSFPDRIIQRPLKSRPVMIPT